LDPLNVNLRIALGGIYYALGRYDEAIQTFQTAVLSKPDLANAHYNLAITYREKGEIQKAIDQMNVVLSLVSKDSKDYEVAQAELENLQKKLPVEKGTGESLTPPPSTPNSTVKPKITLPDGSNPPAQP
jgi:tetratricopeptide (TPR) repeat protein